MKGKKLMGKAGQAMADAYNLRHPAHLSQITINSQPCVRELFSTFIPHPAENHT